MMIFTASLEIAEHLVVAVVVIRHILMLFYDYDDDDTFITLIC